MSAALKIQFCRSAAYVGAPACPWPLLISGPALAALRRDVSSVLESRPYLTGNGLDDRSSGRQDSAPLYERAELLADHSLSDIVLCRRFIRERMRAAASPCSSSSYGLKHDVEAASGCYVTNGAFIVAIVLEGLRISGAGLNADVYAKFRQGFGREPTAPLLSSDDDPLWADGFCGEVAAQ